MKLFKCICLMMCLAQCAKAQSNAVAAKGFLYNLNGNNPEHIIRQGELNPSSVWKGRKLNEAQMTRLLCILRLAKETKQTACFLPFHAFVLYDRQSVPLAALEVDFDCRTVRYKQFTPFIEDAGKRPCDLPADSMMQALKKLTMDIGLPVFASKDAYATFAEELSSDDRVDKSFFLQGKCISALSFDGNNVQTLYAGCRGDLPGSGIVYKSDDMGKSWHALNNGKPPGPKVRNIQSLAVSPIDPLLIFAGTKEEGLFKSMDGGISWEKITTCPAREIKCVAIGKLNTKLIYAGTGHSGVIISDDGGKTWKHSQKNSSFLHVGTLIVDPNNNDIVYAGTEKGCFRSDNRGKDWLKIYDAKEGNRQMFFISPLNRKEIWLADVSARKGQIYKSTDGGAHWKRIKEAGDATFSAFVQSAFDPNRMFAAAGDKALLQSKDGGNTWESFPVPLPPGPISCMLTIRNVLILGTCGGLTVHTFELPKINSADLFDQLNRKIVRVEGTYQKLFTDEKEFKIIIRLQDGRYLLLETGEAGKRPAAETDAYLNKRVAVVGVLYKTCHVADEKGQQIITAPCLKDIDHIELME